jgi:hypothetical protein
MHSLKRSFCRFCLHQPSKGLTPQSAYCPLDLFSGTPDRVNRALSALLETPQNNLRLSFDGRRHNPSRGATAEVFLTSLPLWRDVSGDRSGLLREALSAILLERRMVLERIRSLQETELLDIEGMHLLHLFVEELRPLADGPLGPHLSCCSPETSLALEYVLGHFHPSCDWRELSLWHLREAYRETLRRFRVATTMKDLSILVGLRLLPPESTPRGPWESPLVVRGLRFSYEMSLIDLDAKNRKPLEWYHQRDQEILRAFSQCPLGERKGCPE